MDADSWEIWGLTEGIITLLLMAVFIGIWIWAWRKRHKKTFDRMAALPMEDDLSGDSSKTNLKDTNHD